MGVIRKDFEKLKAQKAWQYKIGATSCADKYKSHVREFPMLVLTSGLLNAVAFAYEKGGIANNSNGEQGWVHVYNNVADWFENQNRGILNVQNGNLLETILAVPVTDSHTIRVASNEVIALFTWLKRFVS
jgi:CRISPR type III-B/RAMP module-associated protein Cmr5